MEKVFEKINLDNLSAAELENITRRLGYFLDTLDPDANKPAWDFFCALEQAILKPTATKATA